MYKITAITVQETLLCWKRNLLAIVTRGINSIFARSLDLEITFKDLRDKFFIYNTCRVLSESIVRGAANLQYESKEIDKRFLW